MTHLAPRRATAATSRFLSQEAVFVVLVACGGGPAALQRAPAPAAPDDEARAVVTVDREAHDRKPGVPPPSIPLPTGDCDPFRRVVARAEGDLTVDVPSPRPSGFLGRLRSQAEGALSAGSPRIWVGPPIPDFVALHQGTTELMLLESSDEGFVAVYRDPYNAGSCTLGDARNCRVILTGYDRCGAQTFRHDLASFLGRPDHLEVQDVRAADGLVYFNEACQSYAREASGQCSSLVAFDPKAGKVLWRTAPLVSNNRFLVAKSVIVTGYGFTSEPDTLFLVRRSDGKVVARHKLPSAHQALGLDGDQLTVVVYPGSTTLTFRVEDDGGEAPRLVFLSKNVPIAG